ncbi:MAG: hypothetical protein P1U84_12040 [Parvibaculaceae bacterium]|nr:hypothetical protein [Parvibaculaceae bacterium]
MVSQPDMFGGVTPVQENCLRDPVMLSVNVVDQTDLALLVDHDRAFAMTWLPKSLCAWRGGLGKQDMAVEKKKAKELQWLD